MSGQVEELQVREFDAERRSVVAALLAAALLPACNSGEDARIEETRRQLVGIWIQDADPGEARSGQVLALAPDGKFTHAVTKQAPGAPSERLEFAGEWSYDGVNLKRRYLQENGRQFSGGGMRYATTPLKSVSKTELVIDDTVNKRESRYRRQG
jgi:hypothetical protein